MKSIQSKFMALILGCILLTVLVIGGAGIVNAERTVGRDSAQIMNLMCAEKAQELNALLSRIEQSVKTIAVYATIQLDDTARFLNDPAYVEAYTEKLEGVILNAAGNTEGAIGVYVRYNPDYTSPSAGMYWSRATLNSAFQPITPTDLTAYNPSDPEQLSWYYTTLKNGRATWIEPYTNENTNVYMISYVIPLYSDCQTIGVVGIDIDFNVLTQSVEDMQVYENGYALLTDKNGAVMDHRDLPPRTGTESADVSLLPVVGELESGAGGDSLFEYRQQGELRRLAFRSLSNGMRLVLTAPARDIDAAKNSLILRICIAAAAIAAAAVASTAWFTRRLVRPLRELTTAARRIAEGDLSVSISCGGRDEVGALADSFRITVEHLRDYIGYINGLAYRDALTGVKNKAAYEDAVQRLEAKMRQERPSFAVIVFDLNNLKLVNDTQGHDFGDKLITDACKLICRTFKSSPVFRIGGDEFVALLENADLEQYPALLEQFEQNVQAHNACIYPGGKISIARGLAFYNPETDQAFCQVFKRADEAMYRNKTAMKAGPSGDVAAGSG